MKMAINHIPVANTPFKVRETEFGVDYHQPHEFS